MVSFKRGKEGFYCVKIVVILLLIKYKWYRWKNIELLKEQLQWPYTSKVLNHSFWFFFMWWPLQQIEWKNKNIFILEVGALLKNKW